jgi:hypothetical protein
MTGESVSKSVKLVTECAKSTNQGIQIVLLDKNAFHIRVLDGKVETMKSKSVRDRGGQKSREAE